MFPARKFSGQDQWDWCDADRNPLFDPSLVADWLKLEGSFDEQPWRCLTKLVAHPLRIDRMEVRLVSMNSFEAGAVTQGENALGVRFHGDIHLFEAEFVGVQDEPFDWRIVINERLDPAQRFVTLVHEVAHVYCGHLGCRRSRDWRDRSLLDGVSREIEAEAVALRIATAIGLRPVDADHLARIGAAFGPEQPCCADPELVRTVSARIAHEAGIGLPDWKLLRQ